MFFGVGHAHATPITAAYEATYDSIRDHSRHYITNFHDQRIQQTYPCPLIIGKHPLLLAADTPKRLRGARRRLENLLASVDTALP